MKKNIVHIYASTFEFELDIDIELLDIRIFTTDKAKFGIDLLDEKPDNDNAKKHLCIVIQSQLEDFEAITDGLAYTRPKLLIAFGVLSFFTQEIFTPFETYQQRSYVGEFEREINEIFIYNQKDLLNDYKKFSSFLNKKETDKKFIYSLLDRWRKALYLEKESEENMIYDDEIILSYFHILELLSTKYSSLQKDEIKKEIKSFTKTILQTNFLIEGANLLNETINKSKLIESILLPEISVSSKIFYMLEKQGIGTNRLRSFINNFVKDRNSVAHGRQVYQDRVIFPVPPFFPLIKQKDYPFELYRILTAKVISTFAGIDLYDEEWDEYSFSLIPTLDELKLFISKKEYVNLSNEDFYNGALNEITPFTVTYYLINHKIKPETALEVLISYINNYTGDEQETIMSIWSIIIIVDIIKDSVLKQKCIDIIKVSEKNNWHPDYFKMRDAMYTLEYLGFEPKTLRELIKKKEIR
jgi:hypothetical protein